MCNKILNKPNWKEILRKSSKLKHKQRRKLVRKIKRSCKRRSLAAAHGNANHQIYLENRNDNQYSEESHAYSFGCMYDYIAREVVHDVVKNLLFIVCNDSYTSSEVKPSKFEFEQHTEANKCIKNLNDTSKNDTNNTSIYTFPEVTSSVVNTEVPNDNDDLLKTLETERFLEELDEEVKKWHNPFLPGTQSPDSASNNNYSVNENVLTSNAETLTTPATPVLEPKVICRFYEKVGSCRFGDNCSRLHEEVTSSNTLLLQGMFSTFAFDIMERAKNTEHGDIDDIWLEHSDADLYDEFVEFYNDVIPELEAYGKLRQFKVCCNRDKHLLGNVYVQYKHKSDAVKAATNLNGRFYAGKSLTVKYILIKSWKSAICGLHYNNRNCPRGHHCNFLHVFKEPSRRFYDADNDNVTYNRSSKNLNRHETRKQNDSFNHQPRKHRRYFSNDNPSYDRHSRRSRSRDKKHKKDKRKSSKKHSKKHKHKSEKNYDA